MKYTTQAIGIRVNFIGATNNKGSRIKMTLPRWKKSRTIPYDHSENGTLNGAEKWLQAQGITCHHHLDMADHYVLTAEWSQMPAIEKTFKLD